jgi:psiF repeat-containing protein
MHAWHGALVAVLVVAGTAAAADDSTSHRAQPNRMKECNAQAADRSLAGDARKQFMAECLKGSGQDHTRTAKADKTSHRSGNGEPSAQAQKMKLCNQDAGSKGLRGDERKQFMSQCLRSEKKP